MCPSPPHSRVGFRSLLAALLAALVVLAAAGGLKASTSRLLAAPEQTPTAPYNALLPIVVGPVASPTPAATWTAAPTATQAQAPAGTSTPGASPGPSATSTTIGSAPPPTATQTPTAAPLPGTPPARTQADAQALYTSHFLPALAESAASTGDVASCIPGAISAARLIALEKQVNYFRQMAGVPPIAFDAGLNAHAQAAALIMAAQGALSHYPEADWKCYSEEGDAAAGRSNLGISYGYDNRMNVVNFMRDAGSNNLSVGHREWLLAPPTQHMGAGEVQGTEWDAYAIYVIDPAARYFDGWPVTRDAFVAWPPPGYVPYTVVYARWSFFLPDADYGAAGVQMQLDGVPVNAPIIYADTAGKASALPNWSGLVWEPSLNLQALDWSTSHRVQVSITNVKPAAGVVRDFTYEMVFFSPAP